MERKDVSTASGGATGAPAFGVSIRRRSGPVVPPAVTRSLTQVATAHNATVGSKAGRTASVEALTQVYRRGWRSYRGTGSRRGHAMARVRTHLSMLSTGARPHPRYLRDDDLLPRSHPLVRGASQRKALDALRVETKSTVALTPVMSTWRRGYGRVWDPQKHPRALHGRFGRVLRLLASEMPRHFVTPGETHDSGAEDAMAKATAAVASAASLSKQADPVLVMRALSNAVALLAAGPRYGDERDDVTVLRLEEWRTRLQRLLTEYRQAYEAGAAADRARHQVGQVKVYNPRSRDAADDLMARLRVVAGLDEAAASVDCGCDHGDGEPGSETKAWNPREHPRDKNGRFISIGAIIKDAAGRIGQVVGRDGRGNVDVRRPDGKVDRVAAGAADVVEDAPSVRKAAQHVRVGDRAVPSAAKEPAHPELQAHLSKVGEAHVVAVEPSKNGRTVRLRFDDGTAKTVSVDDPVAVRAIPTLTDGPRSGEEVIPDPARAAAPRAARPGDEPKRPDGTEWGSGYREDDPRTDPGYDRYTANLDVAIRHALDETGDTQTIHDRIDGVTGAYRPERQAVHDRIIAEFLAQYADVPHERRAIVLAGPMGSGKSTAVNNYGSEFGVETHEIPNPALDDPYRVYPEHGSPTGSGTAEDPVDCGDDVDKAATLLADGKHVRLNQPSQVSTLVAKIAEVVADAEAKGVNAPAYDLCRVSVPGTNLFCAEHTGVPRAEMPQFSGPARSGSPAAARVGDGKTVDVSADFRAMLARIGVGSEEKRVPAAHLRASQSQLDGVKVAAIAGRVRSGKGKPRPGQAPIFITRDGYVLDGHHRWAAEVAVDADDGHLGNEGLLDVVELDLDIGRAIDLAREFTAREGVEAKGVPDAPHYTPVGSPTVRVPSNFAVVNADEMKDALLRHGRGLPPQYAGEGIGEAEAATLLHEESSDLAKRLQRRLLVDGTNTILDGSFSGDPEKNIRKVNVFRAEGYTVTGVLVDGYIDRSLVQAAGRHVAGGHVDPTGQTSTGQPLRGRYVPFAQIATSAPRGSFSEMLGRPHKSANAENFEAAVPTFDGGVVVFDNETGTARLVHKSGAVAETGTTVINPEQHGAGSGSTGRRREAVVASTGTTTLKAGAAA